MSVDKKLPFPFKIEDISEEQKEARRKMYVGPQSLMVNMVRYAYNVV